MSVSALHRLKEKVKTASTVIAQLRKEKERLDAEVSLMREESRRARTMIGDHRRLLAERTRLRERLERLIEKLNVLRI